MPTKHRRHAITETPDVKQALDELRRELHSERLPFREIVILGAREKAARLRAARQERTAAVREVADWIRSGSIPGDPTAAEKVRRAGWTPHV